MRRWSTDLKLARKDKNAAEAGKRINYELPGTRSKITLERAQGEQARRRALQAGHHRHRSDLGTARGLEHR